MIEDEVNINFTLGLSMELTGGQVGVVIASRYVKPIIWLSAQLKLGVTVVEGNRASNPLLLNFLP